MNNKELVWKNIRLKPYEKRNFDFVYKCYQDYDSRPLFTNDFNIISRDEFCDYIDKKANHSFHDFMIIIDMLTNLPIGFIYTYNFNRQEAVIFEQKVNFLFLNLFFESDTTNILSTKLLFNKSFVELLFFKLFVK